MGRSKKDFENKIAGIVASLPAESAYEHQLKHYVELYNESADYLADRAHEVAFIGRVGTGKTTAICRLLALINNGGPLLSTGSDGSTLCEVEVRYGAGPKIDLVPHEPAEVEDNIRDFAQYFWQDPMEEKEASDGFKIRSEVEIALRNILGLAKKETVEEDESVSIEDPMEILKERCSDFPTFYKRLLGRFAFEVRNKMRFWPDGQGALKAWYAETLEAINHGTDPEVGLAKKIILSYPNMPWRRIGYELRAVDTREIDHTIDRTDLNRCLSNPRTLSVLCTPFAEAPDRAAQAMLRRAKAAGLNKRLSGEVILLVLEREGDPEGVMDGDKPIGKKDAGREIRRTQIVENIEQTLQLTDLDVVFFNAKEDPVENVLNVIKKKVLPLREKHQQRLVEYEEAVDIIGKGLQVSAAQKARLEVGSVLAEWLQKSKATHLTLNKYHAPVISFIGKYGTHVSSVHSSVNRRGAWYNLDFYQILGSSARQQVVRQIDPLGEELSGLIDEMQERKDIRLAYPLLNLIRRFSELRFKQLIEAAYAKGRGVYESDLKDDLSFWEALRDDWGQDTGFKQRVATATDDWFQKHEYQTYEQKVSQYLTRVWGDFLNELEVLLKS